MLQLSWELSRFAEPGPEGTRLIVMTRLVAAGLEEHRRAPINVSLVLDRSGSMDGASIEQCKHAARYAISQLAACDQASVVLFSDQVQVLVQHAPVRQKESIFASLMNIHAYGYTNLSGGWLQGAALVEKALAPGQLNRLVLLTDGRANQGVTDPTKLSEIASSLREKGIQTTTVGFGAHFEEDLLSRLSQAGGGNFHFIESPEEASSVFAREFEELLTIVAQNVRLRILPALDVSRIRLLQDFPSQSIPGGLEVNLGDLAAGDECNILVELLIPRGASSQGVSVLQLSYQQVVEPIAFRELSAFVESPTATLAQLPINPVVWREVLLSRVSSQLKEARQEADSGDLDNARKRLQDARKELESSEFSRDPSFTEKCYELERMEGLLADRKNYQERGRKSMSAFGISSGHGKRYTKGGVLKPHLRKALFTARCVLFITARDLALAAGLPDAMTQTFESHSFAQLARPDADPQRQQRWLEWRCSQTESCPAEVHRLLGPFQYRWPTTSVITTSTDGLHTRHSTLEVIELFGSLWRSYCPTCDQSYTGPAPCSHPLRPDIVWPGEPLRQRASQRARELLSQADVLVILGQAGAQTNLAEIIQHAPSTCDRIAITAEAEPAWADGTIRGDVAEGLRTLARETSTSL